MLDANVSLIVASAGLLLIYREFCAPGSVLPGACGGGLFLAGIWWMAQQRPTTPGLILLALSTIMFVAILQYSRAIPYGLAGTACLTAGLLFLFPNERAISPWLALVLGTVLGAATSLLAKIAAAARRNKTVFTKAANDH